MCYSKSAQLIINVAETRRPVILSMLLLPLIPQRDKPMYKKVTMSKTVLLN